MPASIKSPKKGKSKRIPKAPHKWRMCGPGFHWVATHPKRVPPSKLHPYGSITIRHGHCARNPSGKDQLYPDEIQAMTTNNFHKVKVHPCPHLKGFKRAGSQFDELIAGWTQYWNEIFKPKEFLTPNVVKALIASESSFRPKMLANPKNSNSARGLMQITNETRRILGDEKGELKDHYLTLTKEELNDPSNNICAGIRWMERFRNYLRELNQCEKQN